MRRWAKRIATRRISWTDQRIRPSPDGLASRILSALRQLADARGHIDWEVYWRRRPCRKVLAFTAR